jgi:hypothetical protein
MCVSKHNDKFKSKLGLTVGLIAMRIYDTHCWVERCLAMNELGQVVRHPYKLLISHVANQSISNDMMPTRRENLAPEIYWAVIATS